MKRNQTFENKLRSGCTSVRGIGLKDIHKIRKMKELERNNMYKIAR